MDMEPIEISAFWDAEAGVYVATSDEVPGLVAEAATLEALEAKVNALVPELIELNADPVPGPGGATAPHDVLLRLRAERTSTVRLYA